MVDLILLPTLILSQLQPKALGQFFSLDTQSCIKKFFFSTLWYDLVFVLPIKIWKKHSQKHYIFEKFSLLSRLPKQPKNKNPIQPDIQDWVFRLGPIRNS